MLPNIYYLCRNEQEMAHHIFQNCTFTQVVREMVVAEFSVAIKIPPTFTQGRYEEDSNRTKFQGRYEEDSNRTKLQKDIYHIMLLFVKRTLQQNIPRGSNHRGTDKREN
jgi:hypothetical protein